MRTSQLYFNINSDNNGIRTHDLCDSGANALPQLSYESTGSWSIASFIIYPPSDEIAMNTCTWNNSICFSSQILTAHWHPRYVRIIPSGFKYFENYTHFRILDFCIIWTIWTFGASFWVKNMYYLVIHSIVNKRTSKRACEWVINWVTITVTERYWST